MPHSFTHYHDQLIQQILYATSQEEVKKIIDITILEIKQQEKEPLEPSFFAGKILTELELYNPLKKDAQQWSNIQMAKVHLHGIRNGMSETANKL